MSDPEQVQPAHTIGVSDFALSRHAPGKGYSYYYMGSWEDLIQKVKDCWHLRRPGDGESGLDRKIIVPLPPVGFVCGSVLVNDQTLLKAKLYRRDPSEAPYIRVQAYGQWDHDAAMVASVGQMALSLRAPTPEPANVVEVVLYSRAALLENGGKVSGDHDWEIVCLLANPVAQAPMSPMTMARNYLELPCGTKSNYTAKQFAEAIIYWSTRCALGGDKS